MSATARLRPMMTVDVFTATPLHGNPVTVVLDGSDLDDAQMLALARWTRLSETTFVLPPSEAARLQGADYQVRIFSPAGEMDFAGHPTLGTCHAWLSHGGQPQQPDHIVQQCHAGLIPIRPTEQGLAFAAPPVRQRPVPDFLPSVYAALKLDAAQVQAVALLDIGTPWLCLHLGTPSHLWQLRPDPTQLQALAQLFQEDVGIGLCALYPQPAPAALEVRAFTLSGEEDPITGSLNACLAHWLMPQGLLHPPYLAQQGRCVGREGQVAITQDAAQRIWVGGHSIGCLQAQILL